MRTESRPCRDRSAFTLIELVVVVLIGGILAAVAAPKFFETATVANENSQRQDLAVIRDVIELYRFDHGELPGRRKDDAEFKLELAPYLRSPSFPVNRFDENGDKADEVKFRDQGDPLVDHVGGNQGWLYDNTTGEFIANTDTLSSDGVTRYSEF